DLGVKTLRSWDYQNLRVDTITAPMHVLTNTLGLIVALATSRGTGLGLEAALTDAAQFTELLLEPPAVVDLPQPQTFAPRDLSVELRDVTFGYAPDQPPLF